MAEFHALWGFGGFIDGQDDFDGPAGLASVDPEILAGIERIEKGLEIPRMILVRDGRRVSNASAALDLAELLEDLFILRRLVGELPEGCRHRLSGGRTAIPAVWIKMLEEAVPTPEDLGRRLAPRGQAHLHAAAKRIVEGDE